MKIRFVLAPENSCNSCGGPVLPYVELGWSTPDPQVQRQLYRSSAYQTVNERVLLGPRERMVIAENPIGFESSRVDEEVVELPPPRRAIVRERRVPVPVPVERRVPVPVTVEKHPVGCGCGCQPVAVRANPVRGVPVPARPIPAEPLPQ